VNRLIILSDLWGLEHACWMSYYTEFLNDFYEIVCYDCCDLGRIDKTVAKQEELHLQFISGGCDTSVDSLLQKEQGGVDVIGFSIGGYIAWKASFAGLKIRQLFAISSTRLRYEIRKPSIAVELFYGEKDIYKPPNSWFQLLDIEKHVYADEEHLCYQKREIAADICARIVTQAKK